MTLRDGLVLMAPMDAPVTFIGRSTSDSLSLLIAGEDDGFDFYPPSLAMRSSDGKTFEITGRAQATRDGSTFSGSFRGYVSTPAESSEYGYCYADDHRITLTPK